MKILIVEAVKSTPDRPRFVWRVYEHGHELAMGIRAGTRYEAELEAERAVDRIKAQRARAQVEAERRLYAADPELLSEWEALFCE